MVNEITLPNAWFEPHDSKQSKYSKIVDIINGLNSIINGAQSSVIDKDLLTPPGSPSTGDRYLINGVGTGAWAGQDYNITEWDGSNWVFTTKTEGLLVWVDDENKFYYYDGTSWNNLFTAGTDNNAIHDNVASEITVITEKTTLVASDEFIIEDSADSNNKKSAKISAIRVTESQITDLTHTDSTAIHDNVSGEISLITSKATPIAGDLLVIEDAVASYSKKKISIGSISHDLLTGLSDDDHSQYFMVTGRTNENLTLSGTGIITSTDGDYKHILGKAAIGYAGSGAEGYAAFGHRSSISGSVYAIAQTSTANATYINANGTGTIFFQLGGTIYMSMNVSGLILDSGVRINEFSSDGTFARNTDTVVPTEKATKAYVDSKTHMSITDAQLLDLLMYGSANLTYVNCVGEAVSRLDPTSGNDQWLVTTGYFSNQLTGTIHVMLLLPVPSVKGSLKLYIQNIKIPILDADASNYIDTVKIVGESGYAAASTLYISTTNQTTTGVKTFTFTAIDVSSYERIQMWLQCITNTQYALDLRAPQIGCYYA